MKLLGIDYGTKNIGLAISDETGTFARELNILAPKEFWEKINLFLEQEEIGKIVVGLPLNMSGEDSAKTVEVREFKERLEKECGVEVDFMDERLSSSMAESMTGGKHNIDSLAAQIILQNYLDKNKNT